jgi:membrane-associated protein
MPEADSASAKKSGRELPHVRFPPFRYALLAVLGILLLLWVVPILLETIDSGDGLAGFERPYLIIFAFVSFDAVIAILPSESLLTTASALAGQEGNGLTLWLIVLAGGLGAVIGDSLLYWLARTVGRNVLSRKLEQAEKNEKVKAAADVLGQTAALLIIVGRFVAGVRFVVNVTMGLDRYPYPKFLLFSTIGGFVWSAYTCVFSFWIGTSLDGYPVLSIVTSVLFTTALVALLYVPLKRRYQRARADQLDSDVDGFEVAPDSSS